MSAAEVLAARGEPVTARSVREAAGVQMAVAAEVAREWKARAAAAVAVPPVPEVVAARLAGVWAEAVQAARAEHEQAVEGWRAQVEQVEAERGEAISTADEVAAVAQRDAEKADSQISALQDQLTQQVHAVETLRSDLEAAGRERAQAREDAGGARGEATVLREEVTRLRSELEAKRWRESAAEAQIACNAKASFVPGAARSGRTVPLRWFEGFRLYRLGSRGKGKGWAAIACAAATTASMSDARRAGWVSHPLAMRWSTIMSCCLS